MTLHARAASRNFAQASERYVVLLSRKDDLTAVLWEGPFSHYAGLQSVAAAGGQAGRQLPQSGDLASLLDIGE